MSEVYIMPAGPIGEFVYHLLTQKCVYGIPSINDITGFYDNFNAELMGTFCGLKVRVPTRADNSVKVIIASVAHSESIRRQLHELGYSDIVFAHSFFTADNVAPILDYIQTNQIGTYYTHDHIKEALEPFSHMHKAKDSLFAQRNINIYDYCGLKLLLDTHSDVDKTIITKGN